MRPKTTLLTIMIAAVLSTVVIAVGTSDRDASSELMTAAVDLR